ncbi:hypothetical protein SK069_05635 [Patulibacter brassicae]|uniref:DUF5666 domain-containing protein n=1 Tax=Patulibacter brassicae TaxID=1705717 RepID=A0ABU4VI03_9ACTN|nr:hypothetical protein [Patulibacter brassicae]MDX8151065.1 hypothetical protein [Patulibacter brassicae]
MSDSQLHDPETTELDLPDEWEDEASLADDLRARPSRRDAWLRPLPLGLIAVLLLGVGFLVGVQVQKGADDGGGGGLSARMGARGGPPGMGGGGAAVGAAATGGGSEASGATGGDAASGTTVGEVANVKGSRLYVTTSDGETVEVRVGSQAEVQRLSHSSVGGVHPGDTVIVQGTSRSDGSVSATAVQATAPGLTTVAPFGGGRGGASGGGASRAGGSTSSGGSDAGASGSGGGGSAVDELFDGG